MATIHDVAARAGVSPATVSRFLRGQRVRSAEAIQAAVDGLGFQPNVAAQSLKSGRTRAIGVVVPDITNPYFAAVVKGMESVSRDGGYRLLLANTDESVEREAELLAAMARQVDGIILAPVTEHEEAPLELRDSGLPVVFIDRDLADGESFDAVLVDNLDGGRRAAEHLLALGHTRIAMISGGQESTPGRYRRSGFMEALDAAGVEMPQELDLIGDFREERAYQLTLALLSLAEPPTAIFTANNLTTLGTLKALHDMRVDIPGQISVIGFDDLDTGPLLRPPLTVVDRPMVEQGVLAMRLLLHRFGDSQTQDLPRRIVMGIKIIERASTAPPPGPNGPRRAGRSR